MSIADYDRIVDNIETMIDQTGYTIEEIAEVVQEMLKDKKDDADRVVKILER